MASFGDSILRLFKKVAKQKDQRENADQEPQLDGTNEARLRQLRERSEESEALNSQTESDAEPQLPVRGKDFLQGNFGHSTFNRDNERKNSSDLRKLIYNAGDGDDQEMSASEEKVPSFEKVISHHRIDLSSQDEAPLDGLFERPAAVIFSNESQSAEIADEKEATATSADTWSSQPSESLTPGKMANPTEESFKQVASCPTTSPSTLTWLATQPSAEIRAAVASNHHVPHDTLRKLSVDSDHSVRLAVAGNKRTPDDILKQLTHDESRLVSGEAFSALAVREKANALSSGPAFNKFAPPKVNPVQTKVPIIGAGSNPARATSQINKLPLPPLPTPSFSRSASQSLPIPPSVSNLPAGTRETTKPAPSAPPSSSPSAPLSSSPSAPPSSSPSAPPSSSPSSPPAPSSSPPSSSPVSAPKQTTDQSQQSQAQTGPLPAAKLAAEPTGLPQHISQTISTKMLTPRSLPKPVVNAPVPSGLPVNAPPQSAPTQAPAPSQSTAIPAQPAKVPAEPKSSRSEVVSPAVASGPSEAAPKTASKPPVSPPGIVDTKKSAGTEIDANPPAPDGHNLLSNHKFKTTSNHLVASYTDLDAINMEIDNRSPNTWLSLNSEGAIKAYKTQKDTVKDVKMNLSAHNPHGPKRITPQVNITPNATASETINFLKLVAERVSTPPGRLIELAEHSSEEVRAAVAENVNLPAEGFLKLGGDSVSTVKLRLIDNPNCPTELLGTLQNDSDPYVAFEARNALKRLGKGLLKEREQSQFRNLGHGHNNLH